MPRSVPALISFNAGELSPRLWARVDYSRYPSGCRALENFLVLPEGPAMRRPGMRHVARTRGDAVARLIPFEFSTVQAYIIEATAGFFRFYRNGGQILSSGSPYQVAHPYTEADLPLLRWVQSADVLYLAHPRHPPAKLSRTGDTAWTYTPITFTAPPAEWGPNNYPRAVVFHEERLWWAGPPNQPQTLWASKTGAFEDLTTGPAADDALKFSILDGQMNAIRWLVSSRNLLVGTAGGEFSITATEPGSPLTPSDAQARRQTTVGSADVAPVPVAQQVLYVQRAGRAVMELAYDASRDAYLSPDVSVLARHLTRAGIREMAWHQEPWRVLWTAMQDGGLLSLSYLREQEVVAWARHPLGGGGKALSVATIPAAGQNELWAVVERVIGGATRRTVERLDAEFWPASRTDTAGAFFVDGGITYSGTPATAIAGLEHLAGATVQVLADGAAHPDVVVSTSGTATLQRPASVAHFGFGYRSLLETLDIQAGAADGSALTRRRRVHEVGVIFNDTLGGKVGSATGAGQYDLETVESRSPLNAMDRGPPLFTGTRMLDGAGRWDREARVVVVQDQPLPMTCAGIVPRMNTND